MSRQALTDSLRETLALFDDAAPRTTTEVAERLDLGRRSTYDRLRRLVEHDRLETKKVGANARVWWRPATSGDEPDGTASAASLVDGVLDDVEVGIFVLDADFDVVWANETTERYFGLDRERIVGADKRTLVTERIAPRVDDTDAFAETVLATYDDNTYTEEFECRVTPGGDRAERWLEHRSEPIEAGAYAGGRVELYYDVTARVQAERARQDDRAEFESLVETVEEYAIFTLDPEGYVRTWNPGAERIKGYDHDQIVGQHFSTFYTDQDRAEDVPERNLAKAARQGSVEDEGWRVRADGSRFWANVTITAIRDDTGTLDGFAKVTRDMTDRREYERRLREERNLLERIFDVVPVSIGFVSPEGEFTRANARANERLGTDELEADRYQIGTRDVYDEDGEYVPPEERPYMRVFETGERVDNWHCQIDLPDHGRRWLSVNAVPLRDEEGEIERVILTGEDITQLKEQAERLERQRDELEAELAEVFERIDDAFFALDDDWRFTHVNDRAATVLDRSVGELLGQEIWEAFPEAVGTPFQDKYQHALDAQETVAFEAYYPSLDAWLEVRAYPSETGLSVYFRDVTERKERQRELERYETIVETVDDGIYVVDRDGRFTEVNEAYAELTGYDREELLGADVSKVVGEDVIREAQRLEAELASGERTMASIEAELTDSDGETRIGEATFALTGTDDDYERVGVVRDVTERKERERELVQQRERLAALNNLNAVVREITDAVIDQSTREEIEQTVCRHIADSDSYLFAWIGEVDVHSQTVVQRAEAGADGYLDDVTVSVDPDDERGQGPTGRALRTGEMQIARDVEADDRFGPWQEDAKAHGIRSSAAVPIVHGDTVYGVLNVYAGRPDAFEEQERTVIGQLGEVVGHAIAATERKRALMSDEMVELEFRIADVFDALDVSVSTAGRITLDHIVPIEDNEYLVYGSATPDAVESVRALVEAVPPWEEVTFRDGDDAFEARLSDPPVLSAVASVGGAIERAVIEDGDYRMTVSVPPGAEVRRIIGVIEDAYPTVQLLKRRQVTRRDDSAERLERVLSEDLTERQRTVLRAAYYAGFFEWPRDASGEEIAESLDISSPTFSQHLRLAERKVFDALLAGSTEGTT